MSILSPDAHSVNSQSNVTSRYPHITGHPFLVNGKPSGFMIDRGDRLEWLRNDKDHLRNYPGPGLCFDLGALTEAERLNVSIIRIRYIPTACEYVCHIKAIREHGKEFDMGWGRQICLQFKYWTKINADGTVEPATLPKPKPEAAQPALFSFDEPVTRRGAY